MSEEVYTCQNIEFPLKKKGTLKEPNKLNVLESFTSNDTDTNLTNQNIFFSPLFILL